MADAMTSVSSLSFDQGMWDLAVYYGLRPELYFDRFADVKSTSMAPDQGTTVTFTLMTDMAAVSSAISETADIDAVALADTQVTVTLAEYGNAVNTTYKVRATAFVPLSRPVANVLGFNAGISLDTIARNVVQAGSNVRYAGDATSRTTLGTASTADTFKSLNVRRAVVDLKVANVQSFNGFYAGIIHPDVSYDLRTETGAVSWRDPHVYSQPGEIWNGEIGAFEGVRFMESPRAPLFADASDGAGAAGTIDAYATLIFGRQAIAKAYSTYEGRGPLPIVIQSPVIDKLKRFQPFGWHFFGGYARFREAALRRVESISSIGANT